MKCEVCQKTRKRIWQIPDGAFACIFCVPASAFNGYRAWKKQIPELKHAEEVREQRAQQAQINFRSA